MAEQVRKTFSAKLARYRSYVQGSFLVAWLLPLSGALHNICGPVFHCYACPLSTFACPIGVIANFSALHVFPFFAVGLLLAVGGLVGAFICGWVCPFGFLQDILAKVPVRKWRLPAWAGHLRYLVLAAFVLAIPFFFGEEHPLFICKLCPAGAIEGAAPQMVESALGGKPVAWPNAAKIVIVVTIVTAMFFVHRPWCTLFCPLGAIYGLFNRASAFFLRFDPGICTSCEACHAMCKTGVKPDRRANDPRCIRCLECTGCPESALTVGSVLGGGEGPVEGGGAHSAD